MRLLAAALLIILASAAPAREARKPGNQCPQFTSYRALHPGEPLKPRKLAELPPANAYAAVLRHDGRCHVPVVIRYGVGGR